MKVNKLYNLDCREGLNQLEDDSIDCCISSSPYWSLRDYGIESSIWDGDLECKHDFEIQENKNPLDRSGTENKQQYKANSNKHQEGFCSKCGAWKGTLGLEPNFELYIKHLCDIYDDVKRVLKPTGTCWVNLGDTYGGSSLGKSYAKHKKGPNSILPDKTMYSMPKVGHSRGKYDKCLLMLPQRFAIEMINRGWILRNVIIWHKPNCMPSSARDRFTVDFEYVYFFVKKKKYWFEQQREITKRKSGWVKAREQGIDNITPYQTEGGGKWGKPNIIANPSGRNKRTVWKIPTKPNPEAHFATFPPDLVKPMIKSGCPEFICVKCGKPREKIIDNSTRINTRSGKNVGKAKSGKDNDPNQSLHNSDLSKYRQKIISKVIGYSDCGCNTGKYETIANESKHRQGMNKLRGTNLIEKRDLPPPEAIVTYLKEWKNRTYKELDNLLKKEGDTASHWFTNPDSKHGFSYPSKQDWIELKELFDFDDQYDKQMTEIFYETDEIGKNTFRNIKYSKAGLKLSPTSTILTKEVATKQVIGLTDCNHGNKYNPGIVLDLFAGVGTTLKEAWKLGRNYIGFEISKEYCEIAERYLKSTKNKRIDEYTI